MRGAAGRRRRVDLQPFVTEKALGNADHERSGIDDRNGADPDLRQRLRRHPGAKRRHSDCSANASEKGSTRSRHKTLQCMTPAEYTAGKPI